MPEPSGQVPASDGRKATNNPDTTPEVPTDLFEVIGDHPLSEIAKHLGDFLGIGVDAISLTMFISRAAGRMGEFFLVASIAINKLSQRYWDCCPKCDF